ncbi:hypothetical protein [Vibrio nigripulchritudo]|uniref:hypothetical protein n=1 Tax=Vibrio nigripulchritudo TaxID=28173 RepID=UPI0003B20EEF|nr:hypothetical protein [Vibrio nigripulchritudo]CCN73515.1 conserved hypothetical protein [Vibrio nigripulchritudo SFn118]
MNENNSIVESANAVRKLWEKHGIKSPFRLLGFCLSLLPIPVIQQAGMTLDRHLSDKALKEELERIWSHVEQANKAVGKVETLEEAISEIAQTVQDNEALRAECERLSELLGESESEFVIDTSDHSYQQLINSVVQAGQVLISARGTSTNVLENTQVQSSSTHLHASGGSRNFMDGTSFTDGKSSIGMQGISTQGNIQISGNSVGLDPNSALIFGGNPNEVSGECPACRKKVSVDKRKLVGYSSVQCPSCLTVLPFSIG